MGERWYCAQTRSRHERIAQINLERQNFPTYLPTFRASPELIFPGYIFIQFDADSPWGSINGTRGIRFLITTAENNPAPVSDADMASIRDISRVQRDPEFPGYLHPGKSLRLTGGPFTGFVGVCKMATAERVAVLLSILGASRIVRDIPISCVAPA